MKTIMAENSRESATIDALQRVLASPNIIRILNEASNSQRSSPSVLVQESITSPGLSSIVTSNPICSGANYNTVQQYGARQNPLPTVSQNFGTEGTYASNHNVCYATGQEYRTTPTNPQPGTSLQNAQNSLPSTSYAQASNTNIDQTLRQLFRPKSVRNVTIPKSNIQRKKRTKQSGHEPANDAPRLRSQLFRMPVVLLSGPSVKLVPRGNVKKRLREKSFIRDAMTFFKTWSESDVLREIRRVFDGKLEDCIQIELLNSCGGQLVKAELDPGDTLNALLIHRIWKQKALYVRPSVQLCPLIDSCEETSDVDQPSKDKSTDNESLPDPFQPSTFKNEPSTNENNHETKSCHDSINVASSQPPIDLCNMETSCKENESDALQPIIPMHRNLQLSHQIDDVSLDKTIAPYDQFLGLFNDEELEDSLDDVSETINNLPHINNDQVILVSNENNYPAESPNIKDLLKQLAQQIDQNRRFYITINRKIFLECTLRSFKRKGYDPSFKMSVCFTDCLNKTGLNTIDAGGSTREFLRLLVKEMINSHIFMGPQDGKMISQNSSALEQDLYFYAGLGFSVSLVHGGPGPGSFAKITYESLIKECQDLSPTVEDVVDYDIKEKLKAIEFSDDLVSLQNAAADISDMRYLAGSTKPVLKMEDKEIILKELLHFCVFTTTAEPRRRLIEGLKTLGLYEKILEHPKQFEPLFCYFKKDITAVEFLDLFGDINYTDEPLSKYTLEMDVMAYFRDYIFECEAGGTKSTVTEWLVFATGADSVPPLGFEGSPSIGFLHPEENFFGPPQKASSVPKTSTCALRLDLPVVHESYESFRDKMDEAVKCAFGFGLP